jgi:hypothetical protein
MAYPHSNQPGPNNDQPGVAAADALDAFFLDDDFDDSLDRHLFAIRESLAGSYEF